MFTQIINTDNNPVPVIGDLEIDSGFANDLAKGISHTHVIQDYRTLDRSSPIVLMDIVDPCIIEGIVASNHNRAHLQIELNDANGELQPSLKVPRFTGGFGEMTALELKNHYGTEAKLPFVELIRYDEQGDKYAYRFKVSCPTGVRLRLTGRPSIEMEVQTLLSVTYYG